MPHSSALVTEGPYSLTARITLMARTPVRRTKRGRPESGVLSAALLRVLVPLVAPHSVPYAVPLIAAAIAWCGAFAIYLWVFTPWLVSSRLDGMDG